jgi:hypothetical protein
MVCCTMGGLAIAAALAARAKRATAVRFTPTLGLAVAGLLASALGAWHLGHYVERAQANERTLLAEILAQPVCAGPPPL